MSVPLSLSCRPVPRARRRAPDCAPWRTRGLQLTARRGCRARSAFPARPGRIAAPLPSPFSAKWKRCRISTASAALKYMSVLRADEEVRGAESAAASSCRPKMTARRRSGRNTCGRQSARSSAARAAGRPSQVLLRIGRPSRAWLSAVVVPRRCPYFSAPYLAPIASGTSWRSFCLLSGGEPADRCACSCRALGLLFPAPTSSGSPTPGLVRGKRR